MTVGIDAGSDADNQAGRHFNLGFQGSISLTMAHAQTFWDAHRIGDHHMSFFDPVEMSPAELQRAYHGSQPKLCRLGEEFLVWTQDGEVLLDDAEFEEEFEGTPENELADEDLDQPWWLSERDAPWPSEAAMERLYSASLGADLALALHN